MSAPRMQSATPAVVGWTTVVNFDPTLEGVMEHMVSAMERFAQHEPTQPKQHGIAKPATPARVLRVIRWVGTVVDQVQYSRYYTVLD